MAKVRLFTTQGCAYCFVLKDFLKQQGIEFEEIDVASDKKAGEEMIKKSGQMTLPVVEIDGEMVKGFDREKIMKLLNVED